MSKEERIRGESVCVRIACTCTHACEWAFGVVRVVQLKLGRKFLK